MTHLNVRVVPRASKPGVAGVRDGALLVRLQSPPVEGAANDELIQLMAKTFAVPRRDVAIVSGEHSKLKRVAIATLSDDQLKTALQALGIYPRELTS